MFRRTLRNGALAMAMGAPVLLAGCGDKAPPAPPPPPPRPLAIVIPPQPMPPGGASPNLTVPPVDATGLRYSVNRNITPAQTLWNLRSAWNVAALNCHDPRHGDILVNYRTFLKVQQKGLVKANRMVDAEFRAKYGAKFIVPREKYMTEVYNHFALPPTMGEFCTAVQAVGRDAMAVKSAELEAFATRSLPNVEVVFDDFYRKYEKYRADLATWQRKYAPQPTPITMAQPGAAGAGAGPAARPASCSAEARN